METGEILNKLKQNIPGGVLEKSRFGRSSHLSLWVESRVLPRISTFLKSDPSIGLDCLENLSAIELDEALVLTYFLRSSRNRNVLILRCTVKPPKESREVDMPSVVEAWPMAAPQEVEIQELFGIRFLDSVGHLAHAREQYLPKSWNGFPLRKSYVFPTDFLGIMHSRKRAISNE